MTLKPYAAWSAIGAKNAWIAQEASNLSRNESDTMVFLFLLIELTAKLVDSS